MKIGDINIKEGFFIILLVLLAIVMLRIFIPFIDILVIAMIIVQLFYPIFRFLSVALQSKGLASALSTLLVIIFVFIPLFVITLLVTTEILNLVQQFNSGQDSNTLLNQLETLLRPSVQEINNVLFRLNQLGITQTSEVDIAALARDVIIRLQDVILPLTSTLISGTLNVLFYIFLLTLAIIYLFMDFDKLPDFISRFSPLDDHIDHILLTKFTETSRAVIVGNFLVAMAQATAVIIPMVLMQIGAPVLLWIMMVILSLVPVGSGLIFFPVGLLLMLSGRPAEGLFLVVYGAIIINVVDATLRPKLMKGKVQLHPLIIILSVIGGLTVFGPLGIIYGPLISVFFTSLIEVYNNEFGKHEKRTAAISAKA